MKIETKNKMKQLVHNELVEAKIDIDIDLIDLSKSFIELGLDSMKIMNILLDIEEEFGIEIPDNELMIITPNEILNRLN